MMRLGQARGVGAGQVVVRGNSLKLEPLLFKMELFPLLPKTIVKLAGLLMGELHSTGLVGIQIVSQGTGSVRVKQLGQALEPRLDIVADQRADSLQRPEFVHFQSQYRAIKERMIQTRKNRPIPQRLELLLKIG